MSLYQLPPAPLWLAEAARMVVRKLKAVDIAAVAQQKLKGGVFLGEGLELARMIV